MKKLSIAAFCLLAMMLVTSCEKPVEPKHDDDPVDGAITCIEYLSRVE